MFHMSEDDLNEIISSAAPLHWPKHFLFCDFSSFFQIYRELARRTLRQWHISLTSLWNNYFPFSYSLPFSPFSVSPTYKHWQYGVRRRPFWLWTSATQPWSTASLATTPTHLWWQKVSLWWLNLSSTCTVGNSQTYIILQNISWNWKHFELRFILPLLYELPVFCSFVYWTYQSAQAALMRNENMSFVHVIQIRPGAAMAVDSRGQHRPPLLPRHQPSLQASPSTAPSSTVSSSETTTTCMLTRATRQKQRKCDALDAQSWHSHYPLTGYWHRWRENNVNSVFGQTV